MIWRQLPVQPSGIGAMPLDQRAQFDIFSQTSSARYRPFVYVAETRAAR
jgi:hypothetical protein